MNSTEFISKVQGYFRIYFSQNLNQEVEIEKILKKIQIITKNSIRTKFFNKKLNKTINLSEVQHDFIVRTEEDFIRFIFDENLSQNKRVYFMTELIFSQLVKAIDDPDFKNLLERYPIKQLIIKSNIHDKLFDLFC